MPRKEWNSKLGFVQKIKGTVKLGMAQEASEPHPWCDACAV